MAVHIELMRQTDCTLMLYTAGFPIAGILEKSRMESVCLPELETLLHESPYNLYSYNKTFEEAGRDPCFVVQCSERGRKELIIWTHEAINTTDSHPSVCLRNSQHPFASIQRTGKRSFCELSGLSASGLLAGLRETCFGNRIVVLSSP
jgi:hypothetical protein